MYVPVIPCVLLVNDSGSVCQTDEWKTGYNICIVFISSIRGLLYFFIFWGHVLSPEFIRALVLVTILISYSRQVCGLSVRQSSSVCVQKIYRVKGGWNNFQIFDLITLLF